jgi:hypothetical protein
MSHTMTLWERVVEHHLREITRISINKFGLMLGRSVMTSINQFGFIPERSTTEAIFLIR